jgi:hypothetical protein
VFEDLIAGKEKIRKAVSMELCPSCGAAEVQPLNGVFISPKRYAQAMVCLVCGKNWSIVYDEKLNIVEINTGG